MDFEKDLRVEETNVPGLLVFDLPVHGDNRGWFKENWQRAKMTELGWTPRHTDFESGLKQTIEWYTQNRAWWEPAKAETEARYKQQGQ